MSRLAESEATHADERDQATRPDSRVTRASRRSSLAPIDAKLAEELVFGTDSTGSGDGGGSGSGVRQANELRALSALVLRT